VNSNRGGAGRRLFKHQWALWLITSRGDSSDQRRREGDDLRDLAMSLISDRDAWRGIDLSHPQGLQIITAQIQNVTPSAYVDLIRFAASYTLTRRDTRTFADWLTTRMRVQTPEQPAGLPINVPDVTFRMR
jgi:hypothetical protein